MGLHTLVHRDRAPAGPFLHTLRFRLRKLDRREQTRTGDLWTVRIDCPTCRRQFFREEFEAKEYSAPSLEALRKRLREDRDLIPLVLSV